MCLWGVLQCGDTARAKVDQSRPGRLVPDSKPTVSGAELRKATGGEIAELRKLEAWFGSSLMCLHAVGVHAPTLVKAPAFFRTPQLLNAILDQLEAILGKRSPPTLPSLSDKYSFFLWER